MYSMWLCHALIMSQNHEKQNGKKNGLKMPSVTSFSPKLDGEEGNNKWILEEENGDDLGVL